MAIFTFFISLLVALSYVFLIIRITDGWDATGLWTLPKKYIPETYISLIIPVRNEASLGALLDSTGKNDLKSDHYEIIVVDDHSSVSVKGEYAERYPDYHFITLPKDKTGKKQALMAGIEMAKGEYILCTDGDCILPPKFLTTVISYIEAQNVDFVSGLVNTTYGDIRLDAYQFLDFAGLMQVTAHGIHSGDYYMANGANMIFKKESFYEIGGFEGHMDSASGDDMFLIQSMANCGKKVRFLKSPDACNTTQTVGGLGDLLSQRKRWATKTKKYSHRGILRVQATVFLIHAAIVINVFLIPWTEGLSLFSAAFLLFIKGVMDYLLVAKTCRFYNFTRPLKYFFFAFALQFVVFFYSAYWALVGGSYTWKGRKTN